MITNELLDFIRGEQAKGVSKDTITALLKTENWDEIEIEKAFGIANSPAMKTPEISHPIAPFASLSPLTPPPAMNVQPTITQQTFTAQSSPRFGSKKKIMIIGAIAVLVVLVGGTLAFASGAFGTLGKVFSQSIQSFGSTTGSTFDVRVTVDSSGLKGDAKPSSLVSGLADTMNVDFGGSYDTSDPKNIRMNDTFTFSSGTISASADIRALDGSIYASLTKAPDLGFFSVQPFLNKWIVLPYQSESGGLASDPLISQTGVSSNFLHNLSDSQKAHIAYMTNSASFIKITGKHLPAIVDGALSYHFDFDIDQAGTISYIKALSSYLSSIDKNTPELASMTDSDYSKIFDGIKSFHGEAWVGIFDHLPRKISADIEAVNPDAPDDGTVKVSVIATTKDWNKPVSVQAPEGAVTLEQLISQAMTSENNNNNQTPNTLPAISKPNTTVQPATENMAVSNNDALIKSIHESMWAQSKLYYDNQGETLKGFCRSKIDGALPLALKLPPNTVYKCNDASKAWASWSKLSTGNYLCVDSTLNEKLEPSVPHGTSCQ